MIRIASSSDGLHPLRLFGVVSQKLDLVDVDVGITVLVAFNCLAKANQMREIWFRNVADGWKRAFARA